MGTFILLFTILTIIFYCATENGTIGYPIQYCPICGKKLK